MGRERPDHCVDRTAPASGYDTSMTASAVCPWRERVPRRLLRLRPGEPHHRPHRLARPRDHVPLRRARASLSETDPLGHQTASLKSTVGPRSVAVRRARRGRGLRPRRGRGRPPGRDPTGAVTALEYDGFHRLLSVTGPDGASGAVSTTRAEPGAADRPRGRRDAARILRRRRPGGGHRPARRHARFTADAAGLVVAQVDPLGNTTHAVRMRRAGSWRWSTRWGRPAPSSGASTAVRCPAPTPTGRSCGGGMMSRGG